MVALKDATHLYEVSNRVRYGERPGFKITEMDLLPSQKVPWHTHTKVRDSFYVMSGKLKVSVKDPEEHVILGPAEFYSVAPDRPHLVTNAGDDVVKFLVIGDSSGTGDYDFVMLPGTD